MSLRKRVAVLLAALSVMMVMAVPPVMAVPAGGFHVNNGHKADDGGDKNLGGGQEKIDRAHPPHGGGDQHGGGV